MFNRKIHKFTESGLQSMREEHASLELKRKPAVEELTWARDLGDRSENAAYKSARRKLSGIDSRLRFLKRVIENSQVIKPTITSRVDIGCSVVVASNDVETTYKIVGDHEADPTRHMVSYRSPIGQALMGRKVGDKVKVVVPSGKLHLKVEKIFLG